MLGVDGRTDLLLGSQKVTMPLGVPQKSEAARIIVRMFQQCFSGERASACGGQDQRLGYQFLSVVIVWKLVHLEMPAAE